MIIRIIFKLIIIYWCFWWPTTIQLHRLTTILFGDRRHWYWHHKLILISWLIMIQLLPRPWCGHYTSWDFFLSTLLSIITLLFQMIQPVVHHVIRAWELGQIFILFIIRTLCYYFEGSNLQCFTRILYIFHYTHTCRAYAWTRRAPSDSSNNNKTRHCRAWYSFNPFLFDPNLDLKKFTLTDNQFPI